VTPIFNVEIAGYNLLGCVTDEISFGAARKGLRIFGPASYAQAVAVAQGNSAGYFALVRDAGALFVYTFDTGSATEQLLVAKGSQAGCTPNCATAPGQYCGSMNLYGGATTNVWAVYKKGTTGPGYLGCFKDNVAGVRALPGIAVSKPDMTIEMCRDMAHAQSFRYYAVQYSSNCFATNDAASATKFGQSAGGCNMPCAGNALQECGGPDANSVYDYNMGKDCCDWLSTSFLLQIVFSEANQGICNSTDQTVAGSNNT
jgi:hypothetical protein